MSLIFEIISLELRRAFSYRVDFWITFFIGTISRVVISYFLWRAVFSYDNAQQIAGFTFSQMILYSVTAYLVDQIVRSPTLKVGLISREIYDGSMTRYLIYPLGVFRYKFSLIFTQALVGLAQFVLGFIFYVLIFGWPEAPAYSLQSIAMGILCLMPALFSFFLLAFIIELTAFWAENVWSLLVMLRFTSAFLGGAFLPLDLFPQAFRDVLHLLPFYQMIGVPILAFTGRLSLEMAALSLLTSFVWILFFYFILVVVWNRGVKKYAGVGI